MIIDYYNLSIDTFTCFKEINEKDWEWVINLASQLWKEAKFDSDVISYIHQLGKNQAEKYILSAIDKKCFNQRVCYCKRGLEQIFKEL